jgi:F0F1-type ATP synthase assembly protein I
MANPDGRDRSMRVMATAAWFTGMGWTIALAIIVGVVVGNWADGWAGTHPLFLLFGLVAGLAVGLYSAGRMLIRFLGEVNAGPNGAGRT